MNKIIAILSIKILLFLTFMLYPFSSYANDMYKETRILLGTYITIQVNSNNKDKTEIIEECFARIEELGKIFTRHESGILSKLNKEKSIENAPEEFIYILQTSANIQKLTHNAFNPSILPVLEYLESLDAQEKLDKEKITSLYQAVSDNPYTIEHRNVTLKNQQTEITLDGIAKGFIVDEACRILDENNIKNYLVNAGGDIRAKGKASTSFFSSKAWILAIEDPEKKGNYPSYIQLNDRALATSGSYEKHFRDNLHHIIMPTISGNYAINEISAPIKSVSVLAENATLADALATAFSCMSKEMIEEFASNNPDIAYFIIDDRNEVSFSPNWKSITQN